MMPMAMLLRSVPLVAMAPIIILVFGRGEASVAAGRTDNFLGERYRRLAKRRGTKKAIVAVGRSIAVGLAQTLLTRRGRSLIPGLGGTRAVTPPQTGSFPAQPPPNTRA